MVKYKFDNEFRKDVYPGVGVFWEKMPMGVDCPTCEGNSFRGIFSCPIHPYGIRGLIEGVVIQGTCSDMI